MTGKTVFFLYTQKMLDDDEIKDWTQKVRPGDIVMFNLPEQNSTFFSRLVHKFQNIVPGRNRKTHAAMVVDTKDIHYSSGETQLKVIDIEYGRKVSPYFVPLKYGDIDIYRIFNSDIFYVSPDGKSKAVSSVELAQFAANIALALQGAVYSVGECIQALDNHRNNQEHKLNEDYLDWLNKLDRTSVFMCVSFVLTCYQKACIELLGGLPTAFNVNARVAPKFLAHHIETSGYFAKLPQVYIDQILATGAATFRAAPRRSLFTWRHASGDRLGEYEPLLLSTHHEAVEEDEKASVPRQSTLGFFKRNK